MSLVVTDQFSNTEFIATLLSPKKTKSKMKGLPLLSLRSRTHFV
ncbi:hypothetical protein JAMGFMIE_02801 [Rheinheimera sp. MM224]|nr:hypothetical protein JAMGFMIE_02801 [Rheinheimera sp. MM224]